MKKTAYLFLFLQLLLSCKFSPLPAQPLAVSNAPYCPIRFTDASSMQVTAVSAASEVTFSFTSPFGSKPVTWIDVGLEIYNDTTGYCPYYFQAIPLANDCAPPNIICRETAWDVGIWYRNDITGFTSITIPYNSYPPPTPGCYYCYSQGGAGIVTDGLPHLYYAHFYTAAGNPEEAKIVFHYTAPLQTFIPCAPVTSPPAAPPFTFPGNRHKDPPGQVKKNLR